MQSQRPQNDYIHPIRRIPTKSRTSNKDRQKALTIPKIESSNKIILKVLKRCLKGSFVSLTPNAPKDEINKAFFLLAYRRNPPKPRNISQ